MLTLVNLALVVADLLDQRRSALLASKAGKYFASQIEELRAELDALPSALAAARAEAPDVVALDATHDAFGRTLWFATETYLHYPDASEEIVAACKRIRAAFIPALDELTAPFTTEVARARERRALVKERKADLEAIPLADGETLHDAAVAFLDAAEAIHDALAARGNAQPESREGAAAVRSRGNGLLGRLRAELRAEVKKNAALPRDLEAQVFAHADELEAMQPRPKKRAKKGAEEPKKPA